MKWRYKIRGSHVHINVFMNSAFCGALSFRLEEFNELQEKFKNLIEFVEET